MCNIKVKSKYNILLILTGGTICSFASDKGEQFSDTKKAETLIVDKFRNGNCIYRSEETVHFDSKFPLNVLSENMTTTHWNTLIDAMRTYDFSQYDGVIILHGTDTLAYTSAMLSILLSGIKIPVFMVSSQLAVYEAAANGNDNFKAAVELIINGIEPNVYAVYRNDESVMENGVVKTTSTMYLHYGAHLLQCANRSNNFYSCDMVPVSLKNAVYKGKKSLGESMLINKSDFRGITSRVLKIQPYVGLDYSGFSLDGVDAVVHGSYHSGTVATNPNDPDLDFSSSSIMHLQKECQEKIPEIPLFIEPCDKTVYETTGNALRNGIMAIRGLTSEMAYVKTLIGCSLGLRGKELNDYINKVNVNGEFI